MPATNLAIKPQSVKEIKKVAVLGSGVMGAAIAANIANGGIPVLLLDIVPKDAADRSILAKTAIDKMLKSDPSAFTHPKNANLVTAGNLEDDIGRLTEVDWIIEAVIEKVEIKKDVYKKVDAVRKKGSIVSSNTSTIPLSKLTEGASDAFKRDFLVAHFFNPPRYLRLLELVGGRDTSPENLETARRFCDYYLGKGVVECKDTPGFIGNRIGCYWLQVGLNRAIDMNVKVEEADALLGKPCGIPKTAVFGLFDLIGIDLMVLIGRSITTNLPKTDPYAKEFKELPLISKMIGDGYTGRKGKGGFYRMVQVDGKKSFETLNLGSGEYAAQGKTDIPVLANPKASLQDIFSSNDKYGRYAWSVMSEMICYAADLIPEISDDIQSVDEAMKTGYGWKWGPFEIVDQIGAKWFAEKLKSEGRQVPKIISQAGDGKLYKLEGGKRQYLNTKGGYSNISNPEGVITIADLKLKNQPVLKNDSAALWDLGDGVACLEYTTKMNAADNGVLEMIEKSIDHTQKNFKALVIGNDADNFSVGANLNFFLSHAKSGDYAAIDSIIARGHQAFSRLKQADFPVVSALTGMALGGGCEVVLASDAVAAHIESYAGLVEIGVGLIPGWGGCKESLIRRIDAGLTPEDAALAAFEMIYTAKVSKSAQEARDMLILNDKSAIHMNRLRTISEAKALALSLSKGYHGGQDRTLTSPGKKGLDALNARIDQVAAAGKAAPHDIIIMKSLAQVLTNQGQDGEIKESGILELERHNFMELIKTEATHARIEHMLNTGKPLKN